LDQDLVERARSGDQVAFADLVHQVSNTLLGVARRILRDPGLAEDVLQNALLTIWRKLPHLRDAERFEGWAVRILAPTKPLAYAVATVAVIAVSVAALSALSPRFGIGPGPTLREEPSVDLGIFEPAAGRIVYGNGSGIWAIDSAAPATKVQVTSVAGTPLGWSSDGTELLISNMARLHLFILHDDGSQTQLTEQPMSIEDATFSADGSRVVFAAKTGSADGEWTVYSIDADGGPATVLTSQIHPSPAALTFSPDGTRIAYVLWGRGDSEHPVWVMDADGTDAHEILANDTVMGAGHVRDRGALAWSPAGDRIALGLEGTIYTFATDGSDFTQGMSGDSPVWSPDGSQLVSRGSATWHPGTHAARPLPTPVISDSPSISPESEAAFDVGLHYYADETDEGGFSGVLTPVDGPTRIHARVPDGWVASEAGMTMASDEAGQPVTISFWAVGAVFIDPCHSVGRADPPMMQTLDGLAGAFTGWWHGDAPEWGDPANPPRDLPSTTEPVPTTVSGFRAQYLEVRVPDDVDTDDCIGGRYTTWRNADGVERHHPSRSVNRLARPTPTRQRRCSSLMPRCRRSRRRRF
jgi:Sigma-70 region 2/WD40-like Beta Propeller Repeat